MCNLIISALVGFGLVSGNPVVITSAAQYEAQPTLNLLDKNAVDYDYHELGVSIDAAMNLEETKNAFKDRDVIYVTSAGAFVNETGKLPYLATTDEVIWSPTSARLFVDKTSMLLGNDLSRLFPSFNLTNTLDDLPVKKVLTSPTISHTDEIDVSTLPERSLLAKNMEMYYLKDAFKGAKSVKIIIGITNSVGANAFAQYMKYKDQVANMTAHYVLRLLENQSTTTSTPSDNGVNPTYILLGVGGGSVLITIIVVSACAVKKLRQKSSQDDGYSIQE